MQILDTSPNIVFLQEYHERQIRKEAKRGPKSKVVTLGEESCDIIPKS